MGRGSPCGAPLGGATGEVLEGRRIVFGSQSLGARARATAGSEGGGGAGSGRQQRGRGLCARAARYAGWTATAWHPKAGPTPIRATRRARVARRRGRVVQRHRAEAKGAVGRGEAATEGSASGPPGVFAWSGCWRLFRGGTLFQGIPRAAALLAPRRSKRLSVAERFSLRKFGGTRSGRFSCYS